MTWYFVSKSWSSQGVEIATDVDTHYSRRFAFIEMPNDLEISKAITTLNGTTEWGKLLKVEEVKPRLQHCKSIRIKEASVSPCRE